MFSFIYRFFHQETPHFTKDLLVFAGIFLAVFSCSFLVLGILGFVPTEFERETRTDTVASKLQESALEGLGLVPSSEGEGEAVSPVSSEQGELPYRLVASSIKLDTQVVRPASTNYTVLDNALAQGAVYYPGSGVAGKGNMFIFGHSTSFQYVNNKAYQVFNNVKNLKNGDEIEVYGETKVYVYKVREVKLVNANEELVEFSENAHTLTLSTCNSFGQKTDRYVAEADLVSSHTI
jgi:LPXTG-site transpeptidase (sortase) family protein